MRPNRLGPELCVLVTRFKKTEGGWGGGDEKEVRSAVWGSKWLILQAHVTAGHTGETCAYNVYLPGTHTGRGGMERRQFNQTRERKGSPVARPWQHLVWGNMEELYAQGQDAESGAQVREETRRRRTCSADRR